MNKTQFVATLIILLVVNLPIILAQQLNVQKFSGRDGVNGFAKRDDNLQVELTTQGIISKDQIKIFPGGGNVHYSFDTCTQQSDTTSKCTYSTPLTGFYGTEQYKIKLFESTSSDTVLEEKTATITTDVLAPRIEEFTINPEQSREGRTQIHYVASDRAFNPSDANTCSGLKEISFTYGTQKIFSDTGEKLCRKENTQLYEFTTTSNYESKDLCAKATDQLGQESSQACKKFKIDKSPPNIKSIEIFDLLGGKITHLRTGQAKNANIVVEIQGNENDVDADAVTADLSKFNPSLGTRAADRKFADNYFVWENVAITTPSTCGATITATDKIGNTATKTLSCTLGIDDIAPVPKSITTGKVADDKQLLGVNGTILVEFEETGAGMNKSNAFLDLTGIGLRGKEKASECYKSDNLWKCLWKVQPTISGTKTISVHQDTEDDLGNKVLPDKKISKEITVDTEKPVILGIEKIKLTHNSAEFKEVTVAGDNAEFYLKVKGQDFAFANFSDLNEAERVEAEECVDAGDGAQVCKFSAVIQNSGPYLANITFEFSDNAGNTETKKTKLFVYGVSTETPNYWKLGNVECSPKLIDRETASLYAHPVFCALNLERKSSASKAEPVQTMLKDPSSCRGDDPNLISNVELRNSGLKSKRPVIVLTLEPANFEVNNINITCPVEIYSKVGNMFTQTPEERIAKFNLSFYNLPFGELNKNVNEEIDDAVESAEGFLKWVGTIQKFVDYAGKMCQMKSVVTSILSVLDIVLAFAGYTAPPLKTNPLTEGAGEGLSAMRKVMCGDVKGKIEEWYMSGTTGDIFVALDKACMFMECRLTQESAKKDTEMTEIKKGTEKIPIGEERPLIGTVSGGLSYVGGGGIPTVCTNTKDFLEFGTKSPLNLFGDLTTEDVEAKYEGASGRKLSASIDVKDSLFWSSACFCVPGILYNLNKMRQIQCRYATCMMEDMKTKGIPKSYCSDTKHYQTCNFVIGEVFSLLPAMAFLDKFSSVLKDVFSNPIAALSTVTGCLCGGCKEGVVGNLAKLAGKEIVNFCKMDDPPGGILYTACITTKTLEKISDAAYSIGTMAKMADKSYWQVPNNWCEQMEKAQDRRKQAEG